VLDRFIQQAVLQVLQSQWDATFSPSSYGFRPGRSAHQAVARAQRYIAAGRRRVVDIDPRLREGRLWRSSSTGSTTTC
jgi:RNA-directed DNA polymerase